MAKSFNYTVKESLNLNDVLEVATDVSKKDKEKLIQILLKSKADEETKIRETFNTGMIVGYTRTVATVERMQAVDFFAYCRKDDEKDLVEQLKNSNNPNEILSMGQALPKLRTAYMLGFVEGSLSQQMAQLKKF